MYINKTVVGGLWLIHGPGYNSRSRYILRSCFYCPKFLGTFETMYGVDSSVLLSVFYHVKESVCCLSIRVIYLQYLVHVGCS